MSDKIPRFMVNGARPVFAWQAGNGWSFGRDSVKVESVSAESYFAWLMTPEQVATVMDLMDSGVDVSGHFETWYQFCLKHKIT